MSQIKGTVGSTKIGGKGKSKTPVAILAAIDIGFGYIKGISTAKPFIQTLPSAVKTNSRPDVPGVARENIDLNSLIVSTEEDGAYFFGQRALNNAATDEDLRDFARDRTLTPEGRTRLRAGIGLLLPDQDGDYEIYLSTGLPNSDMNTEVQSNLEAFLGKPYTVTFHLGNGHTVTKRITTKFTEIVKQPFGTLVRFLYDYSKKSFIAGSQRWVDSIGVIDFGHGTTDYSVFRNNDFIEVDNVEASLEGVKAVYKVLNSTLPAAFEAVAGYRKSSFKEDELDQIVKHGYLEDGVEKYELSEVRDEAVKVVAERIVRKIHSSWESQASGLKVVLMTGGGANVFFEDVEKELKARNYRAKFVMMEDAQDANVFGFYMAGTLRLLQDQEFTPQEILELFVEPVFGKVA